MACVAGTWTADGRGQPVPGIELRWAGPAPCPDAANVRERIRRLLGAVAENRVNRIAADAEVIEVAGRYRLTLTLRSHGSLLGKARSFDSDSCDTLAGAAAVALAMLVRGDGRGEGRADAESLPKDDKSAAPPPSEAKPSAAGGELTAGAGDTNPRSAAARGATPAAASGTPTAHVLPPAREADVVREPVPDSSSAASRPPLPQERSWHVVITAPVAWIDAGALPSWSYGFGAGVGVRKGSVDVVLDFRFSIPQSASLGDFSSDFERRALTASGCYEWRLGLIGLAPCLLLSVDDVTARGGGPFVTSRSTEVPWVSVGFAARARWSMGGFAALFVSPGLAMAVARPSFVINGVGAVYEAPLLNFATSFGCEWIW